MNDTNIHDGKIKVDVPITLADMKLLKNMTTLTGTNKQLSRLYFVIQQDTWYAWSSDSYVLGITHWSRAGVNSIMAQYKESDPQPFGMYADRLYASVDVKEFNTDVADINKHYKADQLDGYMYLRFEGYAKVIEPRVITDGITGTKYPMRQRNNS